MKTLFAFLKKDFLEQLRSGKITVLTIIFILLGTMNPAVAKLTPWLFEIMADSLAESGMIVTAVSVDAMTSWTQFFKNFPMGLIAFVLLESNILTKEYQSGTLVLTLTKGLERYKVVISKTVTLSVLWSVLYWISFGITYGYNDYFWDNGIAQNLIFSVICSWLFGLLTVILCVFFSTFAKSNTTVLAGTGGSFLAAYAAGFLPKVKEYSPFKLMDAASLLTGKTGADSCYVALAVTVVVCVSLVIAGILLFNRKRL